MGNSIGRKWLGMIVMLLIVLPVQAQTDQDNTRMGSFINLTFNLTGLRPINWLETEPDSGVFIRKNDAFDMTGMIIHVAEDRGDNHLQSIIEQFDAQVSGSLVTIETDALSWSVYQLQREQFEQQLLIDIAFAEQNGLVYWIVMQANSDLYDTLHTVAFLPALQNLVPLDIYENSDDAYSLPVPPDWIVEELAGYTVIHTELGQVMVYIGTLANADAELAMVEFATSVLPADTDLSYEPGDVQEQVLSSGLMTGITFADGTSSTGEIIQAFARVVDDTAYIAIVSTTSAALRQWDNDLDAIINGFTIPEV